MDNKMDAFSKKLNAYLESVATDIISKVEGVQCAIGNSSNDSFALRAYLSFLRNKDGDEVSLVIDIVKKNQGFQLDFDAVGQDGEVLFDGPSLSVSRDFDFESSPEISVWFEDLAALVKKNKERLIESVSKLENC